MGKCVACGFCVNRTESWERTVGTPRLSAVRTSRQGYYDTCVFCQCETYRNPGMHDRRPEIAGAGER